MWQHLDVSGRFEFSHEPVLLVALSTSNPQYQLLYSQARELSSFLLKNLDFKLVGRMYSSSLPPEVSISEQGVVDMISCSYHHHFTGERDIVLMSGVSSPIGEEYEFARSVLSYAKSLGIKELISIGARWAENPIPPTETPKVLGFATDAEGARWLRNAGVSLIENETAFYFTNLIVALASKYDIRGYKLSVNHGEPRPHPRGVKALLEIISKKAGLKLDLAELNQQAKRLEEALRKSGIESGGRMMGELSEEGPEGEQATRDERNIYR